MPVWGKMAAPQMSVVSEMVSGFQRRFSESGWSGSYYADVILECCAAVPLI